MQTLGTGGHGSLGPLGQPGAGVAQLLWVPSWLEPPAATPPLPTCPPSCLSHTWHPRAMWQSDQPRAPSKDTAGLGGWERRVGREAELLPESRGAGQGENHSLCLLWDLEFLRLGLL